MSANPTCDGRITVIIPVMNVERFLDQCLLSIESQTYPDLEILCINDGSTDGSLAIMREHAARDQRIRVIDKPNQGYGATCNRGIDEASGAWVSIVEPDDWVEPDMYRDLLAHVDSLGGDVDVAKSAYWRVYEEGPRPLKVKCAYYRKVKPASQPFPVRDAPELLSHHPSIWSAIYRRKWLVEKGIRFREYPGAGWADNPFLVETLCQTDRIAYLDEPYYCYREDTPEKVIAFARRNPMLPLERWHDMMDVLERLGVEDEAVLSAQNLRGITYCCSTIEACGLEAKGVREAVTRVFSRMDPALVLADRRIKPSEKRLFAQLLGLPDPHVSEISYLPELVSQGIHRLRTCGLGYTLRSARQLLLHRSARVGK